MRIRDEHAAEVGEIRALTARAFASAAHASGDEAAIVDGLRAAGALSLSLVAVAAEGGSSERVVGHAALSPVSILPGAAVGWFGLGPVSVAPERQGQGIGSALVLGALAWLRREGASGCVVLGDPGFYGRFGFSNDPALAFADVPPPFLQRIVLSGAAPVGEVRYHAAFGG